MRVLRYTTRPVQCSGLDPEDLLAVRRYLIMRARPTNLDDAHLEAVIAEALSYLASERIPGQWSITRTMLGTVTYKGL